MFSYQGSSFTRNKVNYLMMCCLLTTRELHLTLSLSHTHTHTHKYTKCYRSAVDVVTTRTSSYTTHTHTHTHTHTRSGLSPRPGREGRDVWPCLEGSSGKGSWEKAVLSTATVISLVLVTMANVPCSMPLISMHR